MFSTTITRTALGTAAALAAGAAMTAPAHAVTNICIPDNTGAPVTSAGPVGTCNTGTMAKLPATAADQQKLLDLLPYITFKANGIGQKPTIKFTGLNVQISKKEYPGYGNIDGTGNLIVGDSGDRYYAATTDQRYVGSENLIVGGSNQWRGRGSTILGEGNRVDTTLSFTHGQNNTNSAFQGFMTGYSKTLLNSYDVMADGSGTDVHWVRYDSAGKVLDSNSSMVIGNAYAYSGYNYSLTRWNGIDAAKCSIQVQIEGPDSTNVTAVASNYYGYAYVRFYKSTASGTTTINNVPHTVTMNCNHVK